MESRTPVHLWIVGALATIWNAFGGFDYLMTQTRNEQYLANFTDPQRVYFDSFPMWMEAAWAFGVWGGLLGSLLLLARSRFAVTAFGVSLAGLAVEHGLPICPEQPARGHDDRRHDRHEPRHLGGRDRAAGLCAADAQSRRPALGAVRAMLQYGPYQRLGRAGAVEPQDGRRDRRQP